MRKNKPGVIYLARRIGAKEQGAVRWAEDGNLILEWTAPDGRREMGVMGRRLARLMMKRMEQALCG